MQYLVPLSDRILYHETTVDCHLAACADPGTVFIIQLDTPAAFFLACCTYIVHVAVSSPVQLQVLPISSFETCFRFDVVYNNQASRRENDRFTDTVAGS